MTIIKAPITIVLGEENTARVFDQLFSIYVDVYSECFPKIAKDTKLVNNQCSIYRGVEWWGAFKLEPFMPKRNTYRKEAYAHLRMIFGTLIDSFENVLLCAASTIAKSGPLASVYADTKMLQNCRHSIHSTFVTQYLCNVRVMRIALLVEVVNRFYGYEVWRCIVKKSIASSLYNVEIQLT